MITLFLLNYVRFMWIGVEMNYLSQVNSKTLYLMVALVLAIVSVMCVVFLVKSYRAGIAIGMDKKVLKRTITASATFTLLPSVSILLGVIALSGTLGVPYSWLRLSVIGALQYELNVAEISANSIGLSGLKVAEMSMSTFVTIALVMTVGILGGILCCIFFLKRYLTKLKKKPQSVKTDQPSFGAYATVAMFIGLCSAYIGAYIGSLTAYKNYMPIFVALVAGVVMVVFEYFTVKKKKAWLDNFSLATSMLIAMVAAVLIQYV